MEEEKIEAVATEEQIAEQEPSETAEQLFKNLRAEYEQKIQKIIVDKDAEINKRDKVIKELINGNQEVEQVKSDLDAYIENMNAKRQKQFDYKN